MEDIFGKYRKQLVRAGIIRSAVLGLALAFTAVGAAAFGAWIARAEVPVIIGLTIGFGAVVFLLAVPFFYLKFFRPTDRKIAERLDALGLDERAVTMYEYKNDGSGMAALQREDAKAKLSSVSGVSGYPAALHAALLLAFGALFAAGAVAGAVLSAVSAGVAVGETEPAAPVAQTYIVTYGVCEAGTGSILGELTQEVEKGGYTEAVCAVPASGYRFAAWVDENKTPLANQNNPRNEVNVRSDISVFALFEKVAPDTPDGDDSDGGDGGEGDSGPGFDHEQNDDGDDGGSGQDDENQEGGGSSGGDSDSRTNNNVIDGTKDYKEQFDREKLENELAGKDIPDDLKDILGDYYDTLKP